ncbi:MAG: hypothetical protein QOD47_209 [Gemmatimonadaceae bacterium]|jgi:hypothetical protein|nr:hypothetical protein [Gemmatimonadaceae bacterium]
MVSSSGPDAESRAALRLLMRRLPGVSVLDGASSVEPLVGSDPPALRAATVIEGTALRAVRVPDFSPEASSGFGAFLDGTQKVQIVAHHRGMPIVIGTVSAAVRVRVDRRMTTWGHQPPRVERKIYLPLRYLPALADMAADAVQASWQILDTSTADKNGEYPSQHPAVLLERATRAVDQDRERLEDRLAEAWCAHSEAPIFIDGGISRSESVASSSLAIGVIKSHRTLYVEGDSLRIVLGLRKGERSSVFRVSPRSRNSVMSWYLRLRGGEGRDPLWGLVRVEVAERERASDRANEISRWIMAETTPLSLPDGRWDKLAYGVRDCEEFLRAIS